MRLRQVIPLIAFLLLPIGCAAEPESADSATPSTEASEPSRTYELRGVIVDRDPMANTLKVDHEAIGDWMGAMTMTFPVRGEDVQNLPDDGQAVTGTVHVAGTDYWLSDVRIVKQGDESMEEGAEETAEQGEPDME